jgi:uncharacterized membrane protein YdbT with pleckstrin-like domain
MPDLVVRPSLKLIRPVYWLIFLLFLAIGIYYQNAETKHVWLFAVPAPLLIWVIIRRIERHFTVISITGDKLRYECGVLSKSTRTIQITKVQDVRVDQSLFQRMLQIGNLSIETAGETSRLTIEDIDHPQMVADQIVDAAHGDGDKREKEKRA